MNPNAWNELVKRAAKADVAPEQADVTAPLGFAGRVVALAREQAEAASWSSLFERRAWRALGMAGAVAVASVLFNLSPVIDSIEQEVMAADDPVTAIMDLS